MILMSGFGLANVRTAVVFNKPAVITHRDPKSGKYWVEWIEGSKDSFWVNPDSVHFIKDY